MPAIEFRNVSYGWSTERPTLSDLSLTVDTGEIIALVGPSGSGKTTALKLINRLLLPSSGSVSVNGTDTTQWDPIRLRRSVGYVIQDVGLFPHMSVADNIAIVPRLERWPADRIDRRVTELLSLIDLDPTTYALRWPDELSGGQRQRVGVARALAADPPVLLLDEPFGAADPVTRADLQSELRRIQTRLQKTVIIVTHDMHEALSLGARVGVLHDGRLIACDTPAVMRKSADPRVARLFDADASRVRSDREAQPPSSGGRPQGSS